MRIIYNLVSCTDLQVTHHLRTSSTNPICTANSVSGGSNAKPVATQISELDRNKGFEVYPNPNNGTFMIHSDSESSLQLINELGQVIKQISLDKNNAHKIQMSELPNGIYFIVGDGIREKIVVNK